MDTSLLKYFEALNKCHQRLDPDHLRRLLYQLLLGVRYLHNNRIIHRDLKPDNITVSRNGRLKLIDFGLARTVERRGYEDDNDNESLLPSETDMQDVKQEEKAPTKRSITKHVATRYYRAPECITYADYGHPMDMWSVGCILGELMDYAFEFDVSLTRRNPADHALFLGLGCAPLSPGIPLASRDHQLNVILDLLGAQEEKDYEVFASMLT